MYWHVSVLHSFSGLNSTPLSIYHILLIHSPIDGQVGCFYLLAILNNATINIHVHVSGWTCVLFLLQIYIGVKLLGHMVTLYLII